MKILLRLSLKRFFYFLYLGLPTFVMFFSVIPNFSRTVVFVSELFAELGMQPPLPPEAIRELVCSCLHRDPVAADLRCSLFVAAAQHYKRDSLLRPFPPRYTSGDNKDFEELVGPKTYL